jgi:excisionase family DNA binding protein
MGQLYTPEEVAGFLRVTPRAVQLWIKRGELPAVRYGRVLRIRQADLVAFGAVLNQPTSPADQAQEQAQHGHAPRPHRGRSSA